MPLMVEFEHLLWIERYNNLKNRFGQLTGHSTKVTSLKETGNHKETGEESFTAEVSKN